MSVHGNCMSISLLNCASQWWYSVPGCSPCSRKLTTLCWIRVAVVIFRTSALTLFMETRPLRWIVFQWWLELCVAVMIFCTWVLTLFVETHPLCWIVCCSDGWNGVLQWWYSVPGCWPCSWKLTHCVELCVAVMIFCTWVFTKCRRWQYDRQRREARVEKERRKILRRTLSSSISGNL